MEKILLRVDELQISRMISMLELDTIPAANEILKVYKELCIGIGDKNTLLDIALNSAMDTEKKYFNAIDQEIKSMGVKNKLIKKSLFKGYENELDKLQDISTKLENQSDNFHFISVKNGIAFLSDNDKNIIREKFTYYVSTEAGIEAYKTAKNTADYMNKLMALVKRSNGPIFYNFEMIAGLFFHLDVNNQHISLSEIDYDFVAKSQ